MANHPALWPVEGLSPREAYSRTLSPSLKARFTGRPQRRMISLGFDASDNDRKLLRMWNAEEDRKVEASDRAKEESISVFHSFLREGLLVATGHKTEKDASEYRIEGEPSPIPIRREAWTSLHINWRRNSAGKGREPERFGLKIFPLLSSPLALETLHGMTLSEAFARYVAGDPELKATEEAMGEDSGAAAWRPRHHPLFDHFGIVWKVSTTLPKDGGDESPLAVTNEERSETPAYSVAQARVTALFELLKVGHLEAVSADSNGSEEILPLSFWLSQGSYVDFKAGDAFKLDEAGKLVPVASGLSLRRKRAAADTRAAGEKIAQPKEGWVAHALGTFPRRTGREVCKRYVTRAFQENAHWRDRASERAIFEDIAAAMREHAGAIWQQKTLADELRRQANPSKSLGKKRQKLP